MKIVFMRHGKPLLFSSGWIAPAGMGKWIQGYDLAEVVREDVPGNGPALARSASFLVSSPSPRALASARQFERTPSIVDDIYCEAALPFADWRFPRLPPSIWACFFRILWFLGYACGAESIQATRMRAGKAADRLVSLAEKGPVLLVGHGIMNRLIARELVARGWTAPKRHRNGYWETSAYEFHSRDTHSLFASVRETARETFLSFEENTVFGANNWPDFPPAGSRRFLSFSSFLPDSHPCSNHAEPTAFHRCKTRLECPFSFPERGFLPWNIVVF